MGAPEPIDRGNCNRRGHFNRRDVRRVLKISRHPISLDRPVGESEDSYFGDFIEDAAGDRPLEVVANRIRDADLLKVLDSLPWRERRVIETALRAWATRAR